MKKVAVVFRGQLKEWNNCKQNFFKMFDYPGFEVVYFFVSWKSDESEFDAEDFKGRNIGKIEFINQERASQIIKKKSVNKFFESYDKILYLKQFAGLVVNEYELENSMVFDAVVNTRPDLFVNFNIAFADELFNKNYGDFVIGSNSIWYKDLSPPKALITVRGNVGQLSDSSHIDDLIFSGNSLSVGVLNSEFEYSMRDDSRKYMFFSPHTLIADYIVDAKLRICTDVMSFFNEYSICRLSSFGMASDSGFNYSDVKDASDAYFELAEFSSGVKVVVPMCDGRAFRRVGDSYVVTELVKSIGLQHHAEHIFICSEDKVTPELEAVLKSCVKKWSIVKTNRPINDQIDAIRAGHSRIGKDDQLIVVNSDQVFDFDIFKFAAKAKQVDCLVLTFSGSNPSLSYSQIDTDTGEVLVVAEKEKISNTANAGLYYFRNAGEMFIAIQKMTNDGLKVNGKFYLSPALNYLIARKQKVYSFSAREIHPLNTVDDIEDYVRKGVSEL